MSAQTKLQVVDDSYNTIDAGNGFTLEVTHATGAPQAEWLKLRDRIIGQSKLIETIARLNRDQECVYCGADNEAKPVEDHEHEWFDMVSDDAVETLNLLIKQARQL